MRVFDAAEYVEALEPPILKIAGRTYRGRLLSMDEWIPFEPRTMRVANQEADWPEARAWIRDFTDATFPPRVWPSLVGVAVTAGGTVAAGFLVGWWPWALVAGLAGALVTGFLAGLAPPASHYVLKLPPRAMVQVVQGFLASQGTALNTRVPTLRTPATGPKAP